MEFLEQSQKGTDQKIIAQLAERGFVYQGYQNDGHEFTGTNGEVLVRRSDGVKFRLVVGELANRIGGESLSLLYQAIVTAEVDPDAFAEIEEIDSDDEADQKVYLRQVKQRKEQIAAAQSQVKQLNRTHGEWIYVLDESVVRGLFPAIDSP